MYLVYFIFKSNPTLFKSFLVHKNFVAGKTVLLKTLTKCTAIMSPTNINIELILKSAFKTAVIFSSGAKITKQKLRLLNIKFLLKSSKTLECLVMYESEQRGTCASLFFGYVIWISSRQKLPVLVVNLNVQQCHESLWINKVILLWLP